MSFRCFGEEELANLREVIESQNLWRLKENGFVGRLEQAFATHLGRRYVHALSTGTSADEAALFGLGLEPGDEVICPASAPLFVSMPVIAIGCIPVLADVDPRTLILSPEGIRARITPRTRAILVVHLFGQPAPMDEIMAVAREHGLKVVEDCAQAYDCTHRGRKVGTIGDVAAFSLQQSKHITCGEGGLVATDDPEVYKRMVMFCNTGMAWLQFGLTAPKPAPVAGFPTRGHFSFGHDYRMSELQGAVALAQLGKIGALNAQRRVLVDLIESELRGVAGIELAHCYPDTQPNYWAYPVRVPEGLGRYGEINYLEVVFQQMQQTRRTALGVPLPDYVQYLPGSCPQAEAGARRMWQILVHPLTEPESIRKSAQAIRAAVAKPR
jgi:dTDP-4-amino-4,6-dideoxygalactose transaminase